MHPIYRTRHFVRSNQADYAIYEFGDGGFAFAWGDVHDDGERLLVPDTAPTAESGVFLAKTYEECVREWRNLAYAVQVTNPAFTAELLAEVA